MSSLEDIINGMPMIENNSKSNNNNALGYLAVKQIIQAIIDFLGKELPRMELNVSSKDSVGLQRDIINLVRVLGDLNDSLTNKNDYMAGMFPKLTSEIAVLKDAISSFKFPEQKDFPSAMDVRINPADIEKMKPVVSIPEFPTELKVSNLRNLEGLLDDLRTSINAIEIPEKVTVKNLKDLKINVPEINLPKDVIESLKKLSLLGRKPEDYISVRLADEKGFYTAIGGAMGSAVSLAPSPGDAVRANGASFTLTLDGTVQRITTSETKIHRLEITGTAPFVWGYDNQLVHTAGSERGCKYLPNGLSQVINIEDLSKVYFRGTSGVVVCGNYLY